MATAAITMKVDRDSEAAFTAAIRGLAATGRYEAPKILELAAVSYVRAARNQTPSARKNAKREVIRLNKGKDGRTKFGVLVLSQQGAPKVLPVYDKSANTIADVKRLDIAAVPHIGAAKNSWYGIFRALRKTVNKTPTDNADKASRVERGGTIDVQTLTLINELSYLLKIAPDVDATAKANAAKDIERKVEEMLKKARF